MTPYAGHLPLAVTMGEPAGIGPELVARIWRKRHELALPSIAYVGSAAALRIYDSDIPIRLITDPTQLAAIDDSVLSVVDVPTDAAIVPGTLNPDNGSAVIKSIDTAVQLVTSGDAGGIVTAPIHKAGLYRAGFDAPGHTEYLARLCGLDDDQSVMMLATAGLRVIPVTAHVPLKDVARVLTADKIIHAGMITAHDLRARFGIERPKLAVAGLNPHAGEDGTIGMEEATHIQPAIWALKDHGIDVVGPAPADTHVP